jgi:hypothetical protein
MLGFEEITLVSSAYRMILALLDGILGKSSNHSYREA